MEYVHMMIGAGFAVSDALMYRERQWAGIALFIVTLSIWAVL